jgi:hypothetical protein
MPDAKREEIITELKVSGKAALRPEHYAHHHHHHYQRVAQPVCADLFCLFNGGIAPETGIPGSELRAKRARYTAPPRGGRAGAFHHRGAPEVAAAARTHPAPSLPQQLGHQIDAHRFDLARLGVGADFVAYGRILGDLVAILQRRDVEKHIRAGNVRLDKTKAPLFAEKCNLTCRHYCPLLFGFVVNQSIL